MSLVNMRLWNFKSDINESIDFHFSYSGDPHIHMIYDVVMITRAGEYPQLRSTKVIEFPTNVFQVWINWINECLEELEETETEPQSSSFIDKYSKYRVDTTIGCGLQTSIIDFIDTNSYNKFSIVTTKKELKEFLCKLNDIMDIQFTYVNDEKIFKLVSTGEIYTVSRPKIDKSAKAKHLFTYDKLDFIKTGDNELMITGAGLSKHSSDFKFVTQVRISRDIMQLWIDWLTLNANTKFEFMQTELDVMDEDLKYQIKSSIVYVEDKFFRDGEYVLKCKVEFINHLTKKSIDTEINFEDEKEIALFVEEWYEVFKPYISHSDVFIRKDLL